MFPNKTLGWLPSAIVLLLAVFGINYVLCILLAEIAARLLQLGASKLAGGNGLGTPDARSPTHRGGRPRYRQQP